MTKKTLLNLLSTVTIVFIAFIVLVFTSSSTPNLFISLLEAIFTGGIISIIPQLVEWHSTESDLSEEFYDNCLDILEWCQNISLQTNFSRETLNTAYIKYRRLLKLKGRYVFSCSMKQIDNLCNILFNFMSSIRNNDYTNASKILKSDLIPELKKKIEPQ